MFNALSAFTKLCLGLLIVIQKDTDNSLLIDGWYGLATVAFVLILWACVQLAVAIFFPADNELDIEDEELFEYEAGYASGYRAALALRDDSTTLQQRYTEAARNPGCKPTYPC